MAWYLFKHRHVFVAWYLFKRRHVFVAWYLFKLRFVFVAWYLVQHKFFLTHRIKLCHVNSELRILPSFQDSPSHETMTPCLCKKSVLCLSYNSSSSFVSRCHL